MLSSMELNYTETAFGIRRPLPSVLYFTTGRRLKLLTYCKLRVTALLPSLFETRQYRLQIWSH